MKRYLYAGLFILLLLVGSVIAAQTVSQDRPNADVARWAPAEKALGVKGDYNPDGSVTFDVPRNLTVTLDGIPLAPGSDLSHEIRMMSAGDKAMAVGELVLLEGEVAGVTRKLREAGIEETALHNHLLHESPGLMYLHFHAYGDQANITAAIRDIIDPLGRGPEGKFDGRGMDTAQLDRIMGMGGKADGGVYGFSIPRADNVSDGGMTLSPCMDISTEISFQPLGAGKALAIGEYVLEANEVEPVIDALAANGIEVTALHSHMLTEQPRLFYLHCWGKGDAETLAGGMRTALDRTNSLTGK